MPNDVACQYASGWLWTIQLNWHQYNKIVFWYSTGLLNRIKRRSTTSQDMVVGIHYINVKSLLIVCSWTYYTNNSIKENCRYYYMSLVWYKTKRIYLLIAIACYQYNNQLYPLCLQISVMLQQTIFLILNVVNLLEYVMISNHGWNYIINQEGKVMLLTILFNNSMHVQKCVAKLVEPKRIIWKKHLANKSGERSAKLYNTDILKS